MPQEDRAEHTHTHRRRRRGAGGGQAAEEEERRRRDLSARKILEPSGEATRPLKWIFPSTSLAWHHTPHPRSVPVHRARVA